MTEGSRCFSRKARCHNIYLIFFFDKVLVLVLPCKFVSPLAFLRVRIKLLLERYNHQIRLQILCYLVPVNLTDDKVFTFTQFTKLNSYNYLPGNKSHIFISSYEGESSSGDSFLSCTWPMVLSKCFLISSVSSVPSKPGRSSRIFSSNWLITVTVTWYSNRIKPDVSVDGFRSFSYHAVKQSNSLPDIARTLNLNDFLKKALASLNLK